MDPSTTKTRPKPLIAILAVVVPLVVIGIAAAVSTTRSDDGAATATTISQSGDPQGKGSGSGTGTSKTEGETTATTAAKGKGKATTSTTSAKREDRKEDIPSDPAVAGPEGERASVTYPQPTVPPGGCSRPSGTAVITLGSVPKPGCLQLGADQPVVVRNRTGKEISFVAISVNEVLAPGSETRIGTAASAFGDGRSSFWSPGNPKLSGIVVVG